MKIQFDTNTILGHITDRVWGIYIKPLAKLFGVAFFAAQAINNIHLDNYWRGTFWAVWAIGFTIWAIATSAGDYDERERERKGRY